MPGDCGAWIVNATTGLIYGHIVAGDPMTGIAFIIPAHKVFADIERRFGARPSLRNDGVSTQLTKVECIAPLAGTRSRSITEQWKSITEQWNHCEKALHTEVRTSFTLGPYTRSGQRKDTLPPPPLSSFPFPVEYLKPTGYLKFAELLLCWDQDLDDMATIDEIDRLKAVFEDNFGYSATTARISLTKGNFQVPINIQVAVFVDDHDGQNHLLIVYHAGHGRTGTNCGHLELGGFDQPNPGLPPWPPLLHQIGCLNKGGITNQQMILEQDDDVRSFNVRLFRGPIPHHWHCHHFFWSYIVHIPENSEKWAIDLARNRRPKKRFCSTLSTASGTHNPNSTLQPGPLPISPPANTGGAPNS